MCAPLSLRVISPLSTLPTVFFLVEKAAWLTQQEQCLFCKMPLRKKVNDFTHILPEVLHCSLRNGEQRERRLGKTLTSPDQRLDPNEQRDEKVLEVQNNVCVKLCFLLDTHGDLGSICRST